MPRLSAVTRLPWMQAGTVVTDCANKMVTALTLEGGQSLATEELQYQLLCVSEDGKCPCSCDYAKDRGCTCRDLQGSITVSVTKSPVALLYPLTYTKTVNYYPIEKVEYTNKCRAGALETSPTCGWYYRDGEQVVDSQVR